jgi:hypothetical protein
MSRQTLHACLSDQLYLEPTPLLERALQDAIDGLWARGDDARSLGLLGSLLRRLFPPGKPLSRSTALRESERAVKAVYLHSHMDQETFDVERAQLCCDSNCYADGTTIPVCNYNVLFREKEARFNVEPARWGPKSGGQRVFSLPVLR